MFIYPVGVHGPFGHACTPQRKVAPLVNTFPATAKPNNAHSSVHIHHDQRRLQTLQLQMNEAGSRVQLNEHPQAQMMPVVIWAPGKFVLMFLLISTNDIYCFFIRLLITCNDEAQTNHMPYPCPTAPTHCCEHLLAGW